MCIINTHLTSIITFLSYQFFFFFYKIYIFKLNINFNIISIFESTHRDLYLKLDRFTMIIKSCVKKYKYYT